LLDINKSMAIFNAIIAFVVILNNIQSPCFKKVFFGQGNDHRQ
jgi:hypothetical protein